jgi:Ca2+-binding EF-hand superfamily protein
MPPTIDEIAELFEFLDADRKGMIKADDIIELLDLREKMKAGNFDSEKVQSLSEKKKVEI